MTQEVSHEKKRNGSGPAFAIRNQRTGSEAKAQLSRFRPGALRAKPRHGSRRVQEVDQISGERFITLNGLESD